ncbi:MAG: DEAD/DEAH box helicase [Actinomycetota bacterium]|nr:DEAD/DEAH box helicase [Actinomycetota bacterium]
MSELLPTLVARSVRTALTDYLATTFALVDTEPREALAEFLSDPRDGIFKGPYLRLRVPFEPAPDGWENLLDWKPPWEPYTHQAAAYARLSSKDLGPDKPRPLPTLVTTGTGSGKTEAFLHPILDHVLRARRVGVTGMKALVLYPMNALADDQAGRITALLTGDPALAGVTAGIYTGDQTGTRTTVSDKGLINDRAVLRDSPPDILLTNYKMLDQLLLREADQPIWRASAISLQYLVLDEFHTYDGAQGTDVALLLRRLGLALKSWWPAEHPDITDEDRGRPLGRITPVATSATLGDAAAGGQGSGPGPMLDFAHTVFGEPFAPDSVVTETRVPIDDWCLDPGEQPESVGRFTVQRLAELAEEDLRALATLPETAVASGDPAAALARGVFDVLAPAALGSQSRQAIQRPLLPLARAHPDVRMLLELTESARSFDQLVTEMFGPTAAFGRRIGDTLPELRIRALDAVVGALSHLRKSVGRSAPSVELTLWIRELSRIDRAASSVPQYAWSDDGALLATSSTGRHGARDADLGAGDAALAAFPAVYCRHCGRSGWGVSLAATGTDLSADDTQIRAGHLHRMGRFRSLIYAPAEGSLDDHGGSKIDGLRWFRPLSRRIDAERPAADDPELLAGEVLPVLAVTGDDTDRDSRNDRCPSCLQNDGIRFLGSAIATQLSVTLTVLFGDPTLDVREKRALVFTDSVQDAAHRAGFIRARSHSMSLRAALRSALTGEQSLETWVDAALDAARDNDFDRYRLVPPDCLENPRYRRYWRPAGGGDLSAGRSHVRKRLLFDAALEIGLQSGFGRTLETTGTIAVQVRAGSVDRLRRIATDALGTVEMPQSFARMDDPAAARAGLDRSLVAWARGTVEHIRQQGGIYHEWLQAFITEGGPRFLVWGGRPRDVGMPAFPPGRSAPGFPRVGTGLAGAVESLLEPVSAAQGWYARWAVKNLRVSTATAPHLAIALLKELAKAGVLQQLPTKQGAIAYALPAASVIVRPLADAELASTLLCCDVCQAQLAMAPETIDQLAGAPCLTVRCPGTLTITARAENFYRSLFNSADVHRIAAAEHSSLLTGPERREVENGFKRPVQTPGDPNVLVATPTLELGIDIGELSSVMLASLPDTAAKYQQRVGRAGRLSGSALAVAFVTGRGEQLPRIGDPLSLISGVVRPPATYLNAEEILKRQFIAAQIDAIARAGTTMPGRAKDWLGQTGPESMIGMLVSRIQQAGSTAIGEFLEAVGSGGSLSEDVVSTVRDWVADSGAAGLVAQVYRSCEQWARDEESLQHRKNEIESQLPELIARSALPAASDEDKRAARNARAAAGGLGKQLSHLRDDPWIGALEERGLLPNYTLLDDSVVLEVNVTWTDPDTGDFQSHGEVVDRGSARALREFAPGATFFGRGLAMRVDGIDLGQNASAVTEFVVCPSCGYTVDLTDTAAPGSCPRCGTADIADMQQRLDCIRLERAFSDVRRDRDQIDDVRDDRGSTFYEVVTAADLDVAGAGRSWTVNDASWGVSHYRRLKVRWFNLGSATGTVAGQPIAGGVVPAPLFRLCSSCGMLDRTAGVNVPHEHRPWCPHRRATDEHVTSVALYRELLTQGVVISLPITVTLADDFAVPSLAAALLAGLREQIGGNPDHLRVESIRAPITGGAPGQTCEALLLHDVVPGGTGYLTDLATPGWIWQMLCRAYRLVAECPCQHENRQACHRCLLPYGRGQSAKLLSRSVAERHLRTLLGLQAEETQADADPAVQRWTVREGTVAPTDPSSVLEQRFRQELRRQLPAVGAAVNEIPSAQGLTLSITGAPGGRVWSLLPQQSLHGSKPDFVLRSTDPAAPRIAVFCDGWAYHASPVHNRIGDDATKRAALRANGYRVVSVVDADLPHDGVADKDRYGWLTESVTGQLLGDPHGAALSQSAIDDVRGGAVPQLLSVVGDPMASSRAAVSDLTWLYLAGTSSRVGLPNGTDTIAQAVELLDGKTTAGPVAGVLWRQPHLVALTVLSATGAPVRTVVVLDDSPTAVQSSTHRAAWWQWLELSNALAYAGYPVVVTARSSVAAGLAVPGSAADQVALSAAFADVPADTLSPAERSLLVELDRRKLIAPTIGWESADGIPLDIAWPNRRVAVVLDLSVADRTELEHEGWTLVAADPDAIAHALSRASNLPAGGE